MEFKFKQGKYASTRFILSPAKFDYLAFFEHFVFLPTKMGTLVEQKTKANIRKDVVDDLRDESEK